MKIYEIPLYHDEDIKSFYLYQELNSINLYNALIICS